MATEIIDKTPVTPDSALGTMSAYYKQRMEYENELQLATLAELAFSIVQMGYYYDEFKDAIKDRGEGNRDDTIDKLIDFMDYLRGAPRDKDLSMINDKKGVLNLAIPNSNVCNENVYYRKEIKADGDAVDASAERFIKESCCGIPYGWGIHEGQLASRLSVPIAGSYKAAAADRRRQEFIKNKIGLVQAAQRSIKALANASSVLAYYERAIAIYQGLADMFIQGFNSAGAGLGVALGKLSSATSSSSASTSSGGTIQIGHTGSGQRIT